MVARSVALFALARLFDIGGGHLALGVFRLLRVWWCVCRAVALLRMVDRRAGAGSIRRHRWVDVRRRGGGDIGFGEMRFHPPNPSPGPAIG